MAAALTPAQKAKKKNAKRQEAPAAFWHPVIDTTQFVTLGSHFRLGLIQRGKQRVSVTDYVESVTWTEPTGNPIQQGTVTWRDPKFVKDAINPSTGDIFVLQYRKSLSAPLTEVWRMRVYDPSRTAATAQRTLTLLNDLNLLSNSEDDFIFQKDSRHKNGWTVKQIIEAVCARYGLPCEVHGGTTRVRKRKAWLNANPLDVIHDAILIEQRNAGRTLAGRMIGRTVVYRPKRRSTTLYLMSRAIIDATLSESFSKSKESHFATALTVRAGHMKQTKKQIRLQELGVAHTEKFAVPVQTKEGIKRWGFVHRNVVAHGAQSREEARKLGLRHLARIAKPVRALTLSHPGMANLHRFDAIRVNAPEVGLHQALVWVTEVAHTLDATQYTMDVTVQFDNPYENKKPDRVNENLEPLPKKKTKKDPPKNNKRKDKIPPPKGPTPGQDLTARASGTRRSGGETPGGPGRG